MGIPSALVNTSLYNSLCFDIKILLTKNKNNLDNRENKIKEDLENSNKLKQQSEARIKEFEVILEKAKKEVYKIHLESKNILNKDIQSKKEAMEKEIEKDILKAQKEILELKKNSVSSIQNISENIASNIIQKLSGDKLNESSIKAAIESVSKKNLNKYL